MNIIDAVFAATRATGALEQMAERQASWPIGRRGTKASVRRAAGMLILALATACSGAPELSPATLAQLQAKARQTEVSLVKKGMAPIEGVVGMAAKRDNRSEDGYPASLTLADSAVVFTDSAGSTSSVRVDNISTVRTQEGDDNLTLHLVLYDGKPVKFSVVGQQVGPMRRLSDDLMDLVMLNKTEVLPATAQGLAEWNIASGIHTKTAATPLADSVDKVVMRVPIQFSKANDPGLEYENVDAVAILTTSRLRIVSRAGVYQTMLSDLGSITYDSYTESWDETTGGMTVICPDADYSLVLMSKGNEVAFKALTEKIMQLSNVYRTSGSLVTPALIAKLRPPLDLAVASAPDTGVAEAALFRSAGQMRRPGDTDTMSDWFNGTIVVTNRRLFFSGRGESKDVMYQVTLADLAGPHRVGDGVVRTTIAADYPIEIKFSNPRAGDVLIKSIVDGQRAAKGPVAAAAPVSAKSQGH